MVFLPRKTCATCPNKPMGFSCIVWLQIPRGEPRLVCRVCRVCRRVVEMEVVERVVSRRQPSHRVGTRQAEIKSSAHLSRIERHKNLIVIPSGSRTRSFRKSGGNRRLQGPLQHWIKSLSRMVQKKFGNIIFICELGVSRFQKSTSSTVLVNLVAWGTAHKIREIEHHSCA